MAVYDSINDRELKSPQELCHFLPLLDLPPRVMHHVITVMFPKGSRYSRNRIHQPLDNFGDFQVITQSMRE